MTDKEEVWPQFSDWPFSVEQIDAEVDRLMDKMEEMGLVHASINDDDQVSFTFHDKVFLLGWVILSYSENLFHGMARVNTRNTKEHMLDLYLELNRNIDD